jgi:hypothetical protein
MTSPSDNGGNTTDSKTTTFQHSVSVPLELNLGVDISAFACDGIFFELTSPGSDTSDIWRHW